MVDGEPTVRSRELSEGLRRVLEQAGLTGEQAAYLLDCSPSRVSRLLSGKRGGSEVDVVAFLGMCPGQGPGTGPAGRAVPAAATVTSRR
ncbi:MAG: helix-turn-helix domain-containing protein [Pseudonocardiaceae bacterium]